MSDQENARGLAALTIALNILRELTAKGVLTQQEVDGILERANRDTSRFDASGRAASVGAASDLLASIRIRNNRGDL